MNPKLTDAKALLKTVNPYDFLDAKSELLRLRKAIELVIEAMEEKEGTSPSTIKSYDCTDGHFKGMTGALNPEPQDTQPLSRADFVGVDEKIPANRCQKCGGPLPEPPPNEGAD